MKEHPILFTGEMVRAILEGRKMQTRRVIKPQPEGYEVFYWNMTPQEVAATSGWKKAPFGCWVRDDNGLKFFKTCPYGQIGDQLWVKETWALNNPILDNKVRYRADLMSPDLGKPWKPSIFMPRWASRITLEVVRVRVERVQEITGADAQAEGWPHFRELFPTINMDDKAINWFRRLWDSINTERGFGWEVNPFCWVISFKVLAVQENSDTVRPNV